LHDLLIGLDLTLPEGVFQELTRLPLLLALLLQHVLQEVRVPLHESLGIFEPVFELFLTISLDPLKQSCQGHLLALPQVPLLFQELLLKLLLPAHPLLGLHAIGGLPVLLRFLIVLDREEDLLLPPHLQELAGPLGLDTRWV
jgi:hypothetical protein